MKLLKLELKSDNKIKPKAKKSLFKDMAPLWEKASNFPLHRINGDLLWHL